MKIISRNPNMTVQIGLKMAKCVKTGQIFALIGDMGGGKTYFTKGFAKGLGVRGIVNSPTFVLMKTYMLKKPGLKTFCHVDAYRLKKPSDIIGIGLKEFLGRSNTVVVIEWADKLKRLLAPYKKTVIKFSFAGKHERILRIKKSG